MVTIMMNPVLRDGCHLNLLNWSRKLLDPAKNLVTKFQLKSAKYSEILIKKLLFLRYIKYTCKAMYQFCSCAHYQWGQALGLRLPGAAGPPGKIMCCGIKTYSANVVFLKPMRSLSTKENHFKFHQAI